LTGRSFEVSHSVAFRNGRGSLLAPCPVTRDLASSRRPGRSPRRRGGRARERSARRGQQSPRGGPGDPPGREEGRPLDGGSVGDQGGLQASRTTRQADRRTRRASSGGCAQPPHRRAMDRGPGGHDPSTLGSPRRSGDGLGRMARAGVRMNELAYDLLVATDPAELARQAGKPPDDWQGRVLRSTSDRIVVCAGRQVGSRPSPQAWASTRRCTTLASSCGGSIPGSIGRAVQDHDGALSGARPTRPHGPGVLAPSGAVQRLRDHRPPRIGDLGAGILRRQGPRIDEAARVPEDLLAAVLPMLDTSGGRLVAISTPSFASLWFYEVWSGADPTWERHHIKSLECPRISNSFLDEQRRIRGDFYWRTEFLAEFVDLETRAFSRAHIEGSVDPEVRSVRDPLASGRRG
jgi:hypothetical protein